MITNNIKDRPKRASAPIGDAHRAMCNFRLPERRHPDYPLSTVKEWHAPNRDNAFIRKVSNFIRLSPGEKECLADLQSQSQKATAGTDLANEGQADHHAPLHEPGNHRAHAR